MATQKVAIVTGAASGIGRALATSLVQKDWLVALLDINTTGGAALAAKLGPSTLFIETDVASYASQSAAFAPAFAQAFTHFGRIDALCANAGIVDRWSLYDLRDAKARTAQDVPPAPDLTATDVDLKGAIYGIRLAVHFMRFNPPLADGSTPGKKIVVTSSIAGAVPHPALPEYSAAKSGVIGLVRAIAPVLKVREGIAVNALCPGLAATAVLPEFVVDAVGGELLTPVAEVVKAYEGYLEAEGEEKTGEVLEVVGGAVDVVPKPRVKTELGRKMMVAGMEPIFGALHGGEGGVDLEGFF